MGYQAKTSATKYAPKDGDTLASILAANAGTFATWQDLAFYNWDTRDPAEINRVLRETVGTSAVDAADPSNTVLKVHPDAPKTPILLAKPQALQNLGTQKKHTFTVTKTQPACAVGIDALDRWFIPTKETCTVSYSLEGLKTIAKKVQLDVYGSNYSAAGAWNKGTGTFPTAADKPFVALYTNAEQTDAPERAKGVAIKEWKGTVSTGDGALGTKTPNATGGTDDRVINVAFSPYTVHLRYFLDDTDKRARLDLGPFWVLFDAAGAPTAASLKVQWNVQNTSRFQGGKGAGQLIIVDKTGAVVFRKPLKAAEMETKGSGMIEFVWTGGTYNEGGAPGAPAKTNSKGGTVAIPDDMPYRVQIQMHTVGGQDKGLALAAMQTEVRLYVHPQTVDATVNPYDYTADKSSIQLSVSQDYLTTKTTLARGAGTEWIQLQLAKGGFHPGPVDGSAGPGYKIALAEFKRSVPKRKASPADNWARFTLDASEGNDVKDAVEDLLASTDWQRPWFGDPGPKTDMTLADATTRLNDPTKALVLWVDDRHTYTDPAWLAGSTQGPATQTRVNTAPEATGNHMHEYTDGDAIVGYKAQSIPRPHIPFAADLQLLGKGDDLSATAGAPSKDDLAIMRRAIGPIRVDWTFNEIDAEPAAEATTDVTQYGKVVTRTHAHSVAVLKTQGGAAYARKDVHLSTQYHNCPSAQGGIRTASNYYKEAFGFAPHHLAPWEPLDVTSRESVATVVHDNLGQGGTDLVAARIGMAGVYLRPSIIGGDGYRVRAQVQFATEGNYKLPNAAVLKARYPLLPQAQSASMRVWKKCSIRAYVCWAQNNSFATFNAATFKLFEPGYLHFTYERNDVGGVAKQSTDIFADDANFQTIVKQSLLSGATPTSPDGKRAQAAAIHLTPNRMWPWYQDAQYGLYEPSAPNTTATAAAGALLTSRINDLFYTGSNNLGLALVRKIEQTTGKLRGHVIIEMTVSDTLYMQEYNCATCGNNFHYAEKTTTGGTMTGKPCPGPGCVGTLAVTGPHFAGYYTCPNGHPSVLSEASLAGGGYAGSTCSYDGSAMTQDQAPTEQYKCTACAFAGPLVETSTGGDHEGEACMTVGCAGTLTVVGATYKEKYACDVDHSVNELVEPNATGGSNAGHEHATCAATPKGHLQRQTPPVQTTTHVLTNGPKVLMQRPEPCNYDGIPCPSLGNPLGVCWNFVGSSELWGHETAHCRHMEHAGNAGGANNAEHDPINNASFPWATINETTVDGQQWDRACLMTYANQRTSYNAARDKLYPCGKCSLKLRGWKIAAVTNPATGVKDP